MMAAWRLNTALANFRAAVDRAFPNRDRTSDGTIGDAAHQASTSDHNPDADGTVDAWDMDVNLRSGDDRAAIEMLKRVFERHPAARYWIHNRQIAHRNTGWRRERYTGSNPHDKHIHWNSNQATENSTAPWILEVGMATLDDLLKEVRALRAEVGKVAEQTSMLHSVIHNGDRGTGKAVTAGGGVPVAWQHKAVWEIKNGLIAITEALSGLATQPQGSDRDTILAALDARAAELRAGQQALRDDLAQHLAPAILGALRTELADITDERLRAASEMALRAVLGSLDQD